MAKANKEEQRKAPILRFKGFTDDWEQRNLNDFGTFHKGKGFSKNDVSSLNGTPVILYGMLYTDFKTNYSVNNISSYINEFNEKNTIFSSGNEIIFPSSGETAIDIARSAAIQDSGIIIGGDLIILKVNSNTELKFIPLIFLNQKYKRKVASLAQGKSIVHIHANDLKNLEILIPQKTEQTKISNLINYIEKLLTLYEQKYRQLQALKCGLLQNIFNNFSAINTVRLNQICALKQWKTISSQKMKKKGYPVFGANGIIGYYDRYNHEKPTICITCRGATSGNILISKPYSYITGNAMCLENLSPDFNIKFLYEYLSYRGLEDVITGSAQPQITSSLLGIVKIPVVPLKKQKSISNVLLSLDSITNIIQIKSNYLKKIKKTLLNTMFI